MDNSSTTVAVQHYLDELNNLGGEAPAEPVVRELLGRSVERLQRLCARLLYGRYPRLARGPMNLRSDEMLSAVVERLIKAMRAVRPQTVRQFFALVNQHIHWELNSVARRLDQGARAQELRESFAAMSRVPAQSSAGDSSSSVVLQAIEKLPSDEREAFDLVRIQGLTYAEAGAVIGVSAKTVQRRLGRCLALLSEFLSENDLDRPSGLNSP